MRPVIGITCDYDWRTSHFQLPSGYAEGVYHAGGLPLLIPPITSPADLVADDNLEGIADILPKIQGLLLTGGPDVHPRYFGEEPHTAIGSVNPHRDGLEIPLCQAAVKVDLPVFGICRGVQLINIALGGDIYQDLAAQFEKENLICHNQSAPQWSCFHSVNIMKGSQLHRILGTQQLPVNSFHHQAVRSPAPGLKVAALAADGVIEAVESGSHSFLIGVQWHPERMLENTYMSRLFEAFVMAADAYKS